MVALSLDGQILWRDTVQAELPRLSHFVGPSQVYVWGYKGQAGVYDVVARRLLWHKAEFYGGDTWRGYLVEKTEDQALLVNIHDGTRGRVVAGIEGPPSAKTIGDLLLVAARRQGAVRLRAVDMNSGEERWERTFTPIGGTEPVETFRIFAGSKPDRFFGHGRVADRGFLIAGSLMDGSLLWSADVYVPYPVPLVSGGRILVLSKGFKTFDEGSGQLLSVGADHGMFYQQCGVAVGDMAVFTSESGHMVAYDVASGRELWTQQFRTAKGRPVSFWGAVAVEDRVYVPDGDGNLWIWKHSPPSVQGRARSGN
jgi:outer membrane protein assembly factor BamB